MAGLDDRDDTAGRDSGRDCGDRSKSTDPNSQMSKSQEIPTRVCVFVGEENERYGWGQISLFQVGRKGREREREGAISESRPVFPGNKKINDFH